MRADARLKRSQIVHAAMAQFRTRPASLVTLESVAADAGVGIATLYRHFPSRADLQQACALGFFDLFSEFLDATIAGFDEDPVTKWEEFVWTLVDYGVGMLVSELVGDLPTEASAKRAQFFADVERLLEKASAHGLVDSSLSAVELATELIVVTRPMDPKFTELFPDVRQRLVRHLLTAWQQGATNAPRSRAAAGL